jgi:hypothetical protein
MSDRLTLARAIEDAGIERAKAERVASAIVDLIHDEVATKADLKAVELTLKADTAAVSADLKGVELALKADLKGVELALKADIAAVSAKTDLIEHRLLTRLGGLMIVVGGVLFAALHYWPPGHGP